MSEKKSTSSQSAQTTIFAVRTTIGREQTVQDLVFSRLRTIHPVPDIKAILTAKDRFRGYVFIEAVHQRDVILICNGVPHVRGKVVGSIPLDEIGHIIKPERVVKTIEKGDIVEIVDGLFKEKRAQVIMMPKKGAKEEVTLRLIGDGESSNITVKKHADYLRLIEKQKQAVTEYVLQEDEAIEQEESQDQGDAEGVVQEEPVRVMIAEEVGHATDDTFSFSEEGEDEDEEEEESLYKKVDEHDDDEEEEEDDWAKFMDT